MPTQTNTAKNNELLFLNEKNGRIYDQCFHRCCTKQNDYTSLSNKQASCIKSCTSKLYNAYSFMYHVVLDQGIQRASETEINKKMIV